MGLLAAGSRNSYLRYRWWYRCCCCCPAAIGATSEDPKVFGKALIFVALGEGIAFTVCLSPSLDLETKLLNFKKAGGITCAFTL